MQTEEFKKIYDKTRNGANGFYRHWANKSFQYSDGVKDLAETGMHWLLDILATELPAVMRLQPTPIALLTVTVVNNKSAELSLTFSDGKPAAWDKAIEFTDLPEGEWIFELCNEGDRIAMILVSEH